MIKLGIDYKGLDVLDYLYLRGIVEWFNGGFVGFELLVFIIGEELGIIEDVYEFYLL